MKQQLIAAHEKLQQIYVRGIDTVHMAGALVTIEQVINQLPDEQPAAEQSSQPPEGKEG